MAQPNIVPGRIPLQQRQTILRRVIFDMTARGWRCQATDRGDCRALLVYGRPVNHIVHVIITILTCGLWVPFWVYIAAAGGEKRRDVHVDYYGNVLGL